MSKTPMKFETVNRDSLYYGKYLYSARFVLSEVSCLRKLDHKEIDNVLNVRELWASRRDRVITFDHRANCHIVADQLLNLKNPFKHVIMGNNWLYFYTGNLEDIETLSQGPMKRVATVSQATVVCPKNTIGLKDPKHQFRTYFKAHSPTEQQIRNLDDFIDANQEYIKPSNGLKSFFKRSNSYAWILDYHYIDHNDMKMVTALALLNPKLVRKTKQIVKINN